jgi:prolyl oligopeptidase
LVNLSGWTRARKDYQVEGGGRDVRALSLAKAGPHDAPADLEAREILVRSHDGTPIPVSIIARKGIRLDGRNPTVVIGYGAYGTTDDPSFEPRVRAWTQHGGVWAVVHVRGGGVFGDAWHQAGRKTTKPNTWKDAIAAAEWLVREGWTSPPKMGVLAASAGGILAGRAITERPDLFAAATPVVGMMDMVRFETTGIGQGNVTEFGTVKNEDEFRALLAMSSYHAVRDGVAYPAVMAVVGSNDIRVDVWQSTKFSARMAAATSSGKPVLMRVDYESGHGQGSTRRQLAERMADVFSFMLWQFGEPEFQPR